MISSDYQLVVEGLHFRIKFIIIYSTYKEFALVYDGANKIGIQYKFKEQVKYITENIV